MKEGAGADEEGVGPLAHKRRKGRLDLAAGAGVENLDLQPDGVRSRLHVCSTSVSVSVHWPD